jgi:Tfp pilus assembly pilus retraction ATPase PilT
MITLDNHLTALVQRGQVRAEDAIDLAQDPHLMREKLLPGGGRPRTL